jgi:modulator of FtsH protease
MALYERDYAQGQTGAEATQRLVGVAFMKKTYQLLAASMITAAAGAYVALPYAPIVAQYHWFIFGFVILMAMFGFNAVRHNNTLSLIALFVFTFVMGAWLAPMISMFVNTGRGNVVGNAFLSTAVLFGSLSLFAINTKKDYSSWGKPLFITFVVLFVMSLVNYFLFHSPIMGIVISAGVLLLFSLFTIYDTQNIANGAYDSPIDAAVSLFLDFFNMFTSMLHLLGIFGGDA